MLNEYKKEFFNIDHDWGYVIYPKNSSENIPVVLHFHGNRGYVKDGEADWLDEPKKQLFFKLNPSSIIVDPKDKINLLFNM